MSRVRPLFCTTSFTILLVGAVLPCPQVRSQEPAEAATREELPFRVPSAIREEHDRLHRNLEAAIAAGGKTGTAAEKLQHALEEHFAEEQRTAMPPLGLLSELATGEATDAMRPAIELADQVRENLERFEAEHRAIEAALRDLERAARAEDHPAHAAFAERLLLHAQHEEQVLYPATMLVGRYLRDRLSAGSTTAPRTLIATLHPLNNDVDGGRQVHGTAVIVVTASTVTFHVRAEGLAPGIAHRQMIHVGGACPDAAADANADGIVDVLEGLPSYGKVLVPLDSDLTDTAAGSYPEADGNGRLRYTAKVSFDTLRSVVTREDRDPDDPIVTLAADAKLAFTGMTVVLHGVSESVTLPTTVRGVAGIEAHRTVPVACGVIEALD